MEGAEPADTQIMICTQCGQQGTIQRGDAYYCGACSITADWREIINLVQDARVETPIAGQEQPLPRSA